MLAVILLLCFSHTIKVSAQQDSPCDADHPCKVGCCSKFGTCGFTDQHCGDGCQSNCNATSECGAHAPADDFDCPINVCCSQYGFCGVTDLFCGDGCQPNSDGGGCGEAPRPAACPTNTNALSYTRRVAYYELFSKGRSCGVKEPEDLPLAPLTHLNLAFVNFGSDFKLIDDNPDWVRRAALMKLKYPNLRINLAVGGWAFNDPPTSTFWTTMANDYENRQTFIRSVVDYLRTYGLDGIDIDWEYPAATDRGGEPMDTDGYVTLVAQLREAFDKEGSGWEISCAIPSSYWYLRGFALESMQKYIDYFNLMSYDIYGVWDQTNEWTGPYLKGHTDWSQIELGLDLLWRNGVKPENVVLGVGFYGRSFTMSDPNCYQPDGVCEFSAGGIAGSCTDTEGVLAYYEIASRNTTLDVQTYYDANNTVKWNVFGGSQWVSYDDAQSWSDKKARLSERCLSGIMIWAIDQDTGNFDAMDQLFGDFSHLQLDGLDNDSAEKLSDLFGQYTGQDCFVTERCTKDGDGEKGSDQVCPTGFQSVATAHNPYQKLPHTLQGNCDVGWYRHICCPKTSMPQHCEWNGAPVRSEIGCSGHCGEGTFELNQDTAIDAKGEKQCYQGSRKLCCQGTALLEQCFWNDCQGPLQWQTNQPPTCPDDADFVAWRYNKPDGTGLCREEYVSPVDGKKGSPLKAPFRSALCCPKGRSFSNCNWSNHPAGSTFDMNAMCVPTPCRQDQVQLSSALDPPESDTAGTQHDYCYGITVPPNTDAHFPLCCDPPSVWNKDWPVDPKKLWSIAYADKNTDKAVWAYDDEYDHNDKDPVRADANKIDGSDAYGFMMLNGAKEAIDDTFGESHTVVRRSAEIPKVKRDILTNNKTLLDSVFEHSEETFYVYCNFPKSDSRCQAVWDGGVEDTIVRLPDHVGEGPFARIVSMELAEDYALPEHHLVHRSTEAINENPVYRVTIDYNFHAARQDRGNVNIRIDYTNLLGYWQEMTNSDPDTSSSRIKRSVAEEGYSMASFKRRVQRGEEHEKTLRKRKTPEVVRRTPYTHLIESRNLAKRWWGTFLRWLEKLTTVRKAEKGDLPLGWAQTLNIFRAQWGCPGKSWSANLRMDLEAELSMQATYAYYFSTTFIPPTNKPDVFFYFGMEPTAYVGLNLVGNAAARLTTGRKKIIDTLSYPGLAIKGIAAVGPTLDVYGEVRGDLNVHGEMKAGVRVTFPKAQAYWPQDDDKIKEYDEYLDLDLTSHEEPHETEVAPTFEAGVQVTAGLAVIVQPEANVGITVGGGSFTGGITLISATVTAYLKAALQFKATGSVNLVTGMFDYEYGAALFYNLGYKAQATVLKWVSWSLGDRNAYSPDRKIDIYGPKTGSIDLTGGRRDGVIRRQMVRLIDSPPEDIEAYNNESMSALADPTWLFRRADDMDVDGPDSPSFTQPITCPAGDSATIKIPALVVNCAAFPQLQVENRQTGAYLGLTTSLCQGYKTLQNLPHTLTHAAPLDASQTTRKNTRRTQSCGNEFESCFTDNEVLYAAIGYRPPSSTVQMLECDEYPWASSEEGGNWKPANERSRLCVPRVQNNHGGQCIEMLSGIQSNVGQMEPVDPPAGKSRVDMWAAWGKSAQQNIWYTEDDVGSVQNRMTDYDNAQPVPVGYSESDWKKTGNSNKHSWVFKRNYTFDIADDASDGVALWDATSKKIINSRDTIRNANGYGSVLCALNKFGQDTYYKYPTDSNGQQWNALCYKLPIGTNHYWPNTYSYTRCYLEYSATHNAKRSDVPTYGGWEVTGVRHLDDDFDAETDLSAIIARDHEVWAEKEARAKSAARASKAARTVPYQRRDGAAETEPFAAVYDSSSIEDLTEAATRERESFTTPSAEIEVLPLRAALGEGIK
ncbi:hypothetical protein GQ53DRAFT_687387, partial [Thozetella sp. PMI_491]